MFEGAVVALSEPETEAPAGFQARPEPVQEPQTTLEWLRQFEADAAAYRAAVARNGGRPPRCRHA